MVKLFKQGEQLSIALLALLFIWVLTTIASANQISKGASELEYVQYIMKTTPLFVISYVNASLITIVVVFFFFILFSVYKTKHRVLSMVAFVFVLVYGLLNLFVYVSQYVYLPGLSHRLFETYLAPDDIASVYNWIHLAPGSTIGLLNSIAYALLGIPSLIFGLFLMREKLYGRTAAYLLFANALFCLLGFIGVYYSISVLGYGLMLGGIFFTAAVFYVFWFMRHMSLLKALFIILIFTNSNLTAGQWEFEFVKDGISVYTRHAKDSNLKPFRGEMEIDASISELLQIIEDVERYPEWCYRTTKVKLTEKHGDSVIYHYTSDTPVIVKNREAWFYNVKEENPLSGVVVLHMRTFESEAPVPSGYLRIPWSNGFWQLIPISPEKTRLVFQMHTNPGGHIPSWLTNMLAIDSPYITMNNLREMIFEGQK
jgi:hypothetical protein